MAPTIRHYHHLPWIPKLHPQQSNTHRKLHPQQSNLHPKLHPQQSNIHRNLHPQQSNLHLKLRNHPHSRSALEVNTTFSVIPILFLTVRAAKPKHATNHITEVLLIEQILLTRTGSPWIR